METNGNENGIDLEPTTPEAHTPPRALNPAEQKRKIKTAAQHAGLSQDLHDLLDGERLLSIQEVARVLGVSVRTVYRLIAEQALPAPVHVRALARMPASDVRTYLDGVLARRSNKGHSWGTSL